MTVFTRPALGDKKMENKKEEYYTIDVMRILKNLWHRAWLIALVGLIFAFGGFSVARFAIAPT